MDGTIILQRRSTRLEIARPDVAEPYYRGTRFDRTGNILALEARGHRYVSRWFRTYDPYRHDAVGGPAEEFTQIGHEEAAPGEGFLKIGVGLLAREAEPYDRFHLYKVLDPGRTTVRTGASEALFRHVIKGYYDYSKKVSIPADCALRISHRFRNTGPSTMDFHVYSHNFFILDGALTGRATRFFLPFTPEGHWRTDYDSVALVPDGIAFSRDLREGETVFMGDLHGAGPAEGCRFILENLDNGLRVRAACDRPMDYAVFWSNTEGSCIEP